MKLYELHGVYNFKKSLEDYPLIGEVSCQMGIGELVEYNGKYYSTCIFDPKHNAAGVREVKEVNLDAGSETFAEPNVVCPVCGYSNDTSFELDDYGEYKCPRCDATLWYVREYATLWHEREVTVQYSTSVVKLPIINR